MGAAGQSRGADIVGLSGARVDATRIGIRGQASRPVVPALPASLAALLLAHRIELEIDACDLFDAQLRGAAPPLVDARIERAYRAGHIPGAVHLPHGFVCASGLSALRPAPYIVVCGSDAHRLDSVRTARAIADLGFAVKLLSGGFSAWAEQGFPIEQGVRDDGRIASL